MKFLTVKRFLLVALLSLIYIPGLPLIPHPPLEKVAAASFTLYGKAIGGWGFTPSTIRNPGPDLVVTTGESVTLTLFSGDSSAAIPHQFCVDYDIPPDYVLNGCDTPQEVATRSPFSTRSEEHTSELQSRLHLVCRLLLEKKKKKRNTHITC